MKKLVLVAVLNLAVLGSHAFAQFGSGIVYDPTQSAHAIQQIQQFNQQIYKAEQQIQKAEQIYTTALQTRNTVVSAYNLSRQLSMAPHLLYQRFVTPWTNWNTVVAVNTYGNTPALLQAINSGIGAIQGLEAVTLGQPPRYPLYGSLSSQSQQFVSAQGATSDLNWGVMQTNLQTLGTMRADSQRRAADIQTLESETYSGDPSQQTYMATMQRINSAALMQLHAQQDANQIAQAAVLQQMIVQKQQQDALTAAFQDAAIYQQQYNSNTAPLLSGFGSSLNQNH
jgi:hypothetical protein